MNNYQIKDDGNKRVLVIGDKEYETDYSEEIIKLIIERKGLARTPDYFDYKENREYILRPLFEYLNSKNYRNLRVLEVGCSAGHFLEFINNQPAVEEIYSFDIDKVLVEIAKINSEKMNLKKIKSLQCLSSKETLNLPYEDDFFDLIIVSAVLEHLPFENRYMYVDEYYRKLKKGGLICFFDTPNRNYPLETHSIGLPFINRFSPQAAFIYAKLFGKLKGISFQKFIRAGTGWRNATYYEALPKTLAIEADDISEEVGYGYNLFLQQPRSLKFKILLLPLFKFMRFISLRLDFPASFFLPYINIVLKKTHSFEK